MKLNSHAQKFQFDKLKQQNTGKRPPAGRNVRNAGGLFIPIFKKEVKQNNKRTQRRGSATPLLKLFYKNPPERAAVTAGARARRRAAFAGS